MKRKAPLKHCSAIVGVEFAPKNRIKGIEFGHLGGTDLLGERFLVPCAEPDPDVAVGGVAIEVVLRIFL